MAFLTPVSTLLTMLKAESGRNLNVTLEDTLLTQLLSNKQRWLAAEYVIPYLEDRWTINVPAGSWFVNLPIVDDIGDTVKPDYQQGIKLEYFYTNVWIPVAYGIGSMEYNYLNSYQGKAQDPIQRWRMIGQNSTFEVWPITTIASQLRFTGQRDVGLLSAPTDVCFVDDDLLVLSVAVDLLMRSKQADAQLRLQYASQRLSAIRANYSRRTRKVIFQAGSGCRDGARLVSVRIAIAGNGGVSPDGGVTMDSTQTTMDSTIVTMDSQ